MAEFAPWFRVLGAVMVFVVAAIGSSWLVSRVGRKIKDMEARTATPVVVIGLTANLVVLGIVLLMVVAQPSASIGDLGIGLSELDVWAFLAVVLVIALTIGVFLVRLDRRPRTRVARVRSPADAEPHDVTGAVLMVAVLVAVAAQEEVLFRGYVVVNLEHLGWIVTAAVSVVVFVAVHVLTNAVSTAQVISWTAGGTLLVLAYLVSGSLWVAILIHLTMDLVNVVVLGIAGRYSLLEIDPTPTVRWRATFRIASSALSALVLIGIYGLHVAPSLDESSAPPHPPDVVSCPVCSSSR